jgi:chitosanase
MADVLKERILAIHSAFENDHELRELKHALSVQLYWEPCLEYCAKLGLQLPISKAVLFDTLIQHGDGNDPDSLGAILSSVDINAEEDETAWLSEFLYHRQNILEHAYNQEIREVWKESRVRVEALRQLLGENPQLEGSVVIGTERLEALVD